MGERRAVAGTTARNGTCANDHPADALQRRRAQGVTSDGVTNADISDDELIGLDEFGLLHENAEQIGAHAIPSVQRIDAGPVSAIKWGDEPPQLVFLHGGGQNAHTWDTVIVGLGLPALAVDLPGHGRSAWREDGDYGPETAGLVREFQRDFGLVVDGKVGPQTWHALFATS